jgi:hypothetical protein
MITLTDSVTKSASVRDVLIEIARETRYPGLTTGHTPIGQSVLIGVASGEVADIVDGILADPRLDIRFREDSL